MVLSITVLLGFALAVFPLVLTPGASFTLVSARGLAGDYRGAWATIAGTAAGILTHALLAGLGLAAVVMRSAELYQLLRFTGAAYLVGLGVYFFFQSRRAGPQTGDFRRVATGREPDGRKLWRAYVANVLNVKAAAIYLTLAPQFIAAAQAGPVALMSLACVHIAVMALWLGLWAHGLITLANRFDFCRWQHKIYVLGGTTLIALGIRSVRPAG